MATSDNLSSSLISWLSHCLTQRWYWFVFGWIALTIGLRLTSPAWESVVKDGDFEFLPAESPSRVGLAALRRAFPEDKAKSQMVLLFATMDGPATTQDKCTTLDVARRLTCSTAQIHLARLLNDTEHLDPRDPAVERLKHQIDSAFEFDAQWFDMVRSIAGAESDLGNRRLIEVFELRRDYAIAINDQEMANTELQTLSTLNDQSQRSLTSEKKPLLLDLEVHESIEDVWTWNDPVLSNKLGIDNPSAKLLALQIREEFMAVQNVKIMQSLQNVIDDCRRLTEEASSVQKTQGDQAKPASDQNRFRIEITGPAAVGADLISAAKASVSRSESYAIIAIILTLLIIYRSPLLVFLPLLTIGIALSVSTSLLSIAAYLSSTTTWFGSMIELYATTRVFLVVLIFGIGTDLTLFLIVRCREGYFQNGDSHWRPTIATSWQNVLHAIIGSGLTTTIGLSMMAFSSFAKFKYSGIAISIALLVTLAVCITFPTAAMAGMGPIAFWPRRKRASALNPQAESEDMNLAKHVSASERFWRWLASWVIGRPGFILLASLAFLFVPAVVGFLKMNSVTYNLVGELSADATSRKGQKLVEQFFPNTETSSITLCVIAATNFQDDQDLRHAIELYRKQLFEPGVTAVQALTDPLGEFPPDRSMSLLSSGAWRRRMLQRHPLTLQKYVSRTSELSLRAARFEIVMRADPFSDEAAKILERVTRQTESISQNPDGEWFESRAAISGTTAGIVDLKYVTQRDESRVQLLVVLSVLGVILVLTKRFELSVYLMLTVLLSYLATLGVTYYLFRLLYGVDYEGLDWKVPLFLFVILVAVGQDYNIYLTSRVLEEQRKSGQRQGLMDAFVSTGGIITSCGLIMFSTFAAMCIGGIDFQGVSASTSQWHVPALRGINELGFALSFGVLLDTFVIRTIVVPAYLAFRRLE